MKSLLTRTKNYLADIVRLGDRRWGTKNANNLSDVSAVISVNEGGISDDAESMFYLTADSAESGTDDPQEVNSAETVSILGDGVSIATRLETPNIVRVNYIGGGGGDDEKVKVSDDDTTAGYLEGKLQEDTGITLTTYSGGANEILGIGTNDAEIDHDGLLNTHNLTTDIDHGSISGLADDDHPWAVNKDGRADGQTLIGGTNAGDDLTLESTSDVTKGTISVGNDGSDVSIGIGGSVGLGYLDGLGHTLIINTSNEVAIGVSGASTNAKVTVAGDLSLADMSAPSNTAGFSKFYSKSGVPFAMDDSGNEYDLSAAGGGGSGALLGIYELTNTNGGATITHTTGANTNTIIAKIQAAGGGGGGASGATNQAAAGGGGGSGSYRELLLAVSPSTGYTCKIGRGGAAGDAAAGNGGDGEASYITIGATTHSTQPGSGGIAMAAGTSLLFALGGGGGIASDTFETSGCHGERGIRLSGTVASGGGGGGNGSNARNTAGAGTAATNIKYGGGGGGGCAIGNTNRAGGVGAQGRIIIEEYS